MRYLPHTEADVVRMLKVCGLSSIEELFSSVPKRLQLSRPLELPPALDEASLVEHLTELAGRNTFSSARAASSRPRGAAAVAGAPAGDGALTPAFLGAGVHAHHIPATVDALASRSEFYTSYTPYQPEVSQGTLQAIFEFQTIVAELFGLEVANASVYDGASGAAEAALMARRLTGRTRVLVADGVHPDYAASIASHLSALPTEATKEPLIRRGAGATPLPAAAGGRPTAITAVGLTEAGTTDLAALDGALDTDVACVIVQSPNFFGVVEDLAPIAARAHAAGALLVAAVAEPLALGLLKSPGEAGADIACGEGIGLAMPPSLGGPGVGLFAATQEHVRALPGRLVGETVDRDGRRGYVLTLSTREQHIRRDKATSNICTNQGLVALAFAVHMCLLGKRGFRELAELNLAKGTYLRRRLGELSGRGWGLRFPGPTFNEVALRVPGGDAAAVADALRGRGILAGVPLGRYGAQWGDTLLVAVTERHRKEDIDLLVSHLATLQGK
jgi:glycine dehydrogenase subunit 1